MKRACINILLVIPSAYGLVESAVAGVILIVVGLPDFCVASHVRLDLPCDEKDSIIFSSQLRLQLRLDVQFSFRC